MNVATVGVSTTFERNMVNRNLIRTLEDDTITQELDSLFSTEGDYDELYIPESGNDQKYEINDCLLYTSPSPRDRG